jgi:hypothetical protein
MKDKDGNTVYAGVFVVRYVGGVLKVVAGCGSPWNKKSHLWALRHLKGGKGGFFKKPLLSQTWGAANAYLKQKEVEEAARKAEIRKRNEAFRNKFSRRSNRRANEPTEGERSDHGRRVAMFGNKRVV